MFIHVKDIQGVFMEIELLIKRISMVSYDIKLKNKIISS